MPGSPCEPNYPVDFCAEDVEMPGSSYETACPVASGGLRRTIGYALQRSRVGIG